MKPKMSTASAASVNLPRVCRDSCKAARFYRSCDGCCKQAFSQLLRRLFALFSLSMSEIGMLRHLA